MGLLLLIVGVLLFLSGAGVAAIILFGLYVLRHVRALRRMHAEYHTHISDLERKYASMEAAHGTMSHDLWAMRADIHDFRQNVSAALETTERTIAPPELDHLLGSIRDSNTPPPEPESDVWARLMDADEP